MWHTPNGTQTGVGPKPAPHQGTLAPALDTSISPPDLTPPWTSGPAAVTYTQPGAPALLDRPVLAYEAPFPEPLRVGAGLSLMCRPEGGSRAWEERQGWG